jgi:hypothetical protein
MTILYRQYDASGALLYIGVAENPFQRKDYDWFRDIVRIDFEHHPTRSTALAAKAAAIRAENPRFNKQGKLREKEWIFLKSRQGAA